MFNKSVVYKGGHFFEKDSNKKLYLKDNVEFLLVSNTECFEVNDPNNKEPEKQLNSEEKEEYVKQYCRRKGKFYIKVANANQEFVFRVNLGKKIQEGISFIFKIELLEDLYAYLVNPDENRWRLLDCLCHVNKCLSNNYDVGVGLYADSLNDAYSKVVTTYFANKRKSSANVHIEMVLYYENEGGRQCYSLGSDLNPRCIKNIIRSQYDQLLHEIDSRFQKLDNDQLIFDINNKSTSENWVFIKEVYTYVFNEICKQRGLDTPLIRDIYNISPPKIELELKDNKVTIHRKRKS